MIKNTIIIILLILLIITIYSYLCISGEMTTYQNDRMNIIVNKEEYIKNKEAKLIETVSCNEQLNKYKSSFNKISLAVNEVN